MSAVVTSALELAGPAAGGKNNDVTKVRAAEELPRNGVMAAAATIAFRRWAPQSRQQEFGQTWLADNGTAQHGLTTSLKLGGGGQAEARGRGSPCGTFIFTGGSAHISQPWRPAQSKL